MTIAESVHDWLKNSKGEDHCDDCITKAVRLSRRQQAFRIYECVRDDKRIPASDCEVRRVRED